MVTIDGIGLSPSFVRDVLEQYAACDLDKVGLLEHLGLHDAVNLIKLSELFAALGLGEQLVWIVCSLIPFSVNVHDRRFGRCTGLITSRNLR